MAGNAYVSHQHRLVAFWSPKCACTSVVDWFFAVNGFADRSEKRKWLAENGFLYNYRQARHLVLDLDYRSVQFTRDPHGRAISAYLNKFYIYKNKPLRELNSLEDFSQKFINSYNSYKGMSTHTLHGLSFIDYLEFVEYLISKNKVINHHWDTQLPRDVSVRTKPSYFVKQENFGEDLTKVNSAFGFESFIPRNKNKTEYPANYVNSEDDLADRNSLELLKKGIFLRKNNLLNEHTKLLIRNIYAEDFEFFNYPVDNPETVVS